MGGDHAMLLGPGFRFHPTDEELVVYYLRRKVSRRPFRFDAIAEIDLYKLEPWDLPGQSRLKTRDLEWYFFTSLDKKYGQGSRTNRSTKLGYWKTTGKDCPVFHNSSVVGARKTLVYHEGRAPRGGRTNWVMHEYRLEDEELVKTSVSQDAFVLCRIFQKSGAGPKNGEQYGAPFIEEEWEDDGDPHVALEKEELEVNSGCGRGDRGYATSASAHLTDYELTAVTPSVGVIGWSDDGHYLERITEETEENDNIINAQNHSADRRFSLDMIESTTNLSEAIPYINDENYIELNDLANPTEDVAQCPENSFFDPDMIYYDAVDYDNLQAAIGSFMKLHDLVDPGNLQADFELLDEYLQYFDVTDDNLEQCLVALNSTTNSASRQEAVRAESFSDSPQEPKEDDDEGSSSLKRKADLVDGQRDQISSKDFQFENDDTADWTKSIKKRHQTLLNFSPAHAAEGPFRGSAKYGDQSPEVHLTGSVRVEGEMMYESGLMLGPLQRQWLKSEDVGYMLTYAIPRNLISNSVPGKMGSVIAQFGLFMCSLCALLIAVSCKIGFFIHIR